MTSFVLAGKIIEIEPMHILLFKESKKLSKSISAGPKSSSPGDGRGGLINHLVRSVAYPSERLLKEPGVLISPKGLGTFGIKTYFEIIGMHYDYFIKGEDPWD